jgi:hypothetical protein
MLIEHFSCDDIGGKHNVFEMGYFNIFLLYLRNHFINSNFQVKLPCIRYILFRPIY